MRKPVTFGLIGFGNIGTRYLTKISENQQARLVAISDIKPRRLKEVPADIKKYRNYLDLINDPEVEVVIVAVPNNLHSEMTIAALKAHKHVICEKPMALSVLSANKMILAAEKSKGKLFVVKQNRFNPPVQKLKEFLEENKLGELGLVVVNCFWNRNDDYYKSSDWKGKAALDGGTLYTQFSHFIDIMYYLAGDVIEVSAQGMNLVHQKTIEFEDTGVISLKFASGALGSISYTTASYQRNLEGSIALFGEKGSVKIGGQYLNKLEYFSIKGVEKIRLARGNMANNYGTYQGSMSNHDKIITNVVSTLRGKTYAATSAFEGMKVVQIIQAAYQSMKAEKPITIN